jgi:hypothetical protein
MSEVFKSEPAVVVNTAETKAALAAGRVPEPEATRWTQMFIAHERSSQAMARTNRAIASPEELAMIAEAEEKYGKEFVQRVESDEEVEALEVLLDAAGISHSRTVYEYSKDEWQSEQWMREEGREVQQLEKHFKL